MDVEGVEWLFCASSGFNFGGGFPTGDVLVVIVEIAEGVMMVVTVFTSWIGCEAESLRSSTASGRFVAMLRGHCHASDKRRCSVVDVRYDGDGLGNYRKRREEEELSICIVIIIWME